MAGLGIGGVLAGGCAPSKPSSPVLPPQNVVFDVSGDPGFSTVIEHPGAVDPVDKKFHYRIVVRKLGPVADVTSPSKLESEKRIEVPSPEHGKRPVGSQVVETKPIPPKSWKEVHGEPKVDGAKVVDFERNTNQDGLWAQIEGGCVADGDISCVDVSGKPDALLASKVKAWYESRSGQFHRKDGFNRVVVLKNPNNLGYSMDFGTIGYDASNIQSSSEGDLTFMLLKLDEAIVECPIHLKLNRSKQKFSPWFEVPTSGVVTVDGMEIQRVKSTFPDQKPFSRLALSIKPFPKSYFMLSAKSTIDGPEDMVWATKVNGTCEINLSPLQVVKWLRFSYFDEQSVLWKHIPLKPGN